MTLQQQNHYRGGGGYDNPSYWIVNRDYFNNISLTPYGLIQ